MSRGLWHRMVALWRAEFLSPKDFLRRAALISLVFLVAHLAGLKDYTSFLNGTAASVEMGRGVSAFLGLAYVFAYLGFVPLVPILLLAAAIVAAWRRLTRARA
jgi:hypothetical protein